MKETFIPLCVKPPLMGSSSTWRRNPKLTVCPCLHRWVKSQTAACSSLSGQGWMIWGAQGLPVAQPSATIPNRNTHIHLGWAIKWFSSGCFRSTVFTCAGVRSQFFATSKTTGWESSSPLPKEEYAWKHTPYSLHTLLSSAWHSCGWNSTWKERPLAFSKCYLVFCACMTCAYIPVAAQEEFCSSAVALSCVQACSWIHQWPSAFPERATPPVKPNSWLCCLGIQIVRTVCISYVFYNIKSHFTGNKSNTNRLLNLDCVGQTLAVPVCQASGSGKDQCSPSPAQTNCEGLLP